MPVIGGKLGKSGPYPLFTAERRRGSQKTKDPSGGTTGRVKPYGRLGWMGARAEYSLDGEGLPLPLLLVAEGPPYVQTAGDLF